MSFVDASRLDRHAYLDSVIHRFDPRAKVLATLVFIVTVVSYDKYTLGPLLPFLAFPVVLAVLGFVPLGLIARRFALAFPVSSTASRIFKRTPSITCSAAFTWIQILRHDF